ncbi:hypothetical protein GV828_08155 [Flavobacterium sp. NST-5]|uniref:Uncharacterized protein n=1 Tax=Flavobacterium ichthyis TaxID=2698827 RepID=A0ABW9Z8H2_9FLAO|nr:hypothetical protein [Flavobacterium ichthyis]NBL65168.1 hypothetical protein [Flavobacterium ichthyis]
MKDKNEVPNEKTPEIYEQNKSEKLLNEQDNRDENSEDWNAENNRSGRRK